MKYTLHHQWRTGPTEVHHGRVPVRVTWVVLGPPTVLLQVDLFDGHTHHAPQPIRGDPWEVLAHHKFKEPSLSNGHSLLRDLVAILQSWVTVCEGGGGGGDVLQCSEVWHHGRRGQTTHRN